MSFRRSTKSRPSRRQTLGLSSLLHRKLNSRAPNLKRVVPVACILALLTLLPVSVFYNRSTAAQAGSLVLSVTATVPVAGPQPGVFTITRAGDTSQPLKVGYALGGTASRNVDYTLDSSNSGNAADFNPPFGPGKVGQALSLNGTNQFLKVPDAPSLRLTSVTIEGWINFAGLNLNQTIAGKAVGVASDADSYILFYYDKSLRGVACKKDGCTPDKQLIHNFTPLIGVWYHAAFTYDAGTGQQKLYLNGVNVATGAGPGGAPDYDSNPFLIGADTEFGGKNHFFNGRLDEITLYNRALSVAELQSIFNADSAGKCQPGAVVPNCVAPPPGIVSWFQSEGNIIDSNSVRSLFGEGKVAQAFSLNGGRHDRQEEQYVQYKSNASQDPTEEATVDAWINFNQVPSETGRFMTIFAKSAQFRFFDLLALGDDRIRLFVGGGSSVSSNTVFQKGQWYHIAVTYKANTELKIYVNGVLENTQPISEKRAANDNPLTIGNSAFDRSRNFGGLIDEAQMYNRALSASEIQAIFNAGSAGLCKPIAVANCVQPPAGLVGWWPGDGDARDLVTKARGTVIGYDDRIAGQELTFPAGQTSITVNVRPIFSANSAGKTVVLTLLRDVQNVYALDDLRSSATVALRGQSPSTDVSLSSIAPNKGGNTGSVTPVIYGYGFKQGVTVKLVRAGQADIVATQTNPAADELSVAAAFDLTGKAQGVYDVVVTNPGGTPKTLAAAFTIEQAKPASLSTSVITRDVIRVGTTYNFYVLYGQGGNIDITNVPLWVGVPNYVSIVPDTNLPFEVVPINDRTYIKIILPRVRAGSDESPEALTVKVKVADAINIHRDFRMRVLIFNPAFEPESLSQTAVAGESYLVETVSSGRRLDSGVQSSDPCASFTDNLNPDGAPERVVLRRFAERIVFDITFRGGEDAAKCLDKISSHEDPKGIGGIMNNNAQWQIASAQVKLYDLKHGPPTSPQTSGDPNEKSGEGGVGTAGYITGKESLPYSIYFENMDTASLPAQDVFVTDQLDLSKVDSSTFRFGLIAFGNRRFTPPAGQKSFAGYVDLRPEKNLLVKIAAGFDATTGRISWTFNSLDPASGGPPDDPFAGFLPPNKTSPEGQGSVTFTIMPKASLTTDTPVTNTARIIFDVNAPIDTNVHLNTIDKSSPTSLVAVLAATQPMHSFAVNWAGTDTGSGVRDFTVFVSENGGPFTVWQVGTKATSAIFYGRANISYRFYSIAFDRVDNQEAAKTTAEATTVTPGGNPITDPRWFARQHYVDFLSREPDGPGLAFWTGEITECNDPAKRQPGESLAMCIERKRANTSAAFFLSPEFQNTGSFVVRVYWGTLGKLPNTPKASCPSLPDGYSGQCRPLYSDYIADVSQITSGIVVNDQLDPNVINANKKAFVDRFVNTAAFKAKYDSLNNQQFVDTLFQTTGINASASDRAALVNGLSAQPATETRSSVVFKIVDGTTTLAGGALRFDTTYGKAFYDKEFDDAFVFMEYIGYLRRNPDQAGYEFWLGKLKLYGNWQDAQMVLAFISAPEYRARFGQP